MAKDIVQPSSNAMGVSPDKTPSRRVPVVLTYRVVATPISGSMATARSQSPQEVASRRSISLKTAEEADQCHHKIDVQEYQGCQSPHALPSVARGSNLNDLGEATEQIEDRSAKDIVLSSAAADSANPTSLPASLGPAPSVTLPASEDFDRSVEVAADVGERRLIRTLGRILSGPRILHGQGAKEDRDLDELSASCAAALPLSSWWEGVSLLEDFDVVDLSRSSSRCRIPFRTSPGPSSPVELESSSEVTVAQEQPKDKSVRTADFFSSRSNASARSEVGDGVASDPKDCAVPSIGGEPEAGFVPTPPAPVSQFIEAGTPPETVGYVTTATPEGEPSVPVAKRLLFQSSPTDISNSLRASLRAEVGATSSLQANVTSARLRCPRQLTFPLLDGEAPAAGMRLDGITFLGDMRNDSHASDCGRATCHSPAIAAPAVLSTSAEDSIDSFASEVIAKDGAGPRSGAEEALNPLAPNPLVVLASPPADDALFLRAPTIACAGVADRNRAMEEEIDRDIRRLRSASALLCGSEVADTASTGGSARSLAAAASPLRDTEVDVNEGSRSATKEVGGLPLRTGSEPAKAMAHLRSPSSSTAPIPESMATLSPLLNRTAASAHPSSPVRSPARIAAKAAALSQSPARASKSPGKCTASGQGHSPGAIDSRRPMAGGAGMSVRVTRRVSDQPVAGRAHGEGHGSRRGGPDGAAPCRQPLMARPADASAMPVHSNAHSAVPGPVATTTGCGRGDGGAMPTNKVDLLASMRLARRAPLATGRPSTAERSEMETREALLFTRQRAGRMPAEVDALHAAGLEGGLRCGRVMTPIVVCGPAVASREPPASLRPPCLPPPPACMPAASTLAEQQQSRVPDGYSAVNCKQAD